MGVGGMGHSAPHGLAAILQAKPFLVFESLENGVSLNTLRPLSVMAFCLANNKEGDERRLRLRVCSTLWGRMAPYC